VTRWLVPSILALIAAASGVLALHQPALATSHLAGLAAPKAPVLSVRRVPDLLTQTIADARLTADLDHALAEPAAADSCLVVQANTRTLYSRNPAKPLIPASNLKLLTATAAVAKIGADTPFATEVKANDPIGPDGTVTGPLYLVGGGDPIIETAEYAASFKAQPQIHTPFEQLADDLVAKGLKHVAGPIVGDESRFDTQRYVPSWKPRYITDGESGPLSALMVNDGFIQWKPKGIAVAAPATHAAQVLTDLLKSRGVSIDGPAGQSQTPASAVTISELRSPPLSDVVAEMLKQSDNTTAELLAKELGRRVAGQATTAAGVQAVRSLLAAARLPVEQYRAVDGSGLDRSDQATCSLIVTVLAAAPPGGPIRQGLAVAGKDGTLFDRFKNTPAADRLRAKTGSLEHVVALSGYVDEGDAPPLTFSLIANDTPNDAAGRALGDRVGVILAEYPNAPAPASLAP
jgi:D-alanyl-D-alanine carboxypeptidase/D-alanyl-D-alanine-endopeptidase (penicillin-binding protein 4)